MHIDREKSQGNIKEAIKRVSFCLDKLEGAQDFDGRINLDTDVVSGLTVEEIIGALISAEQELTKLVALEKLEKPKKGQKRNKNNI